MCDEKSKCSKNRKGVLVQIWNRIARWQKDVENTLTLFHYEVLKGKGKISYKMAVEKQKVSMINIKLFKIRIMLPILTNY